LTEILEFYEILQRLYENIGIKKFIYICKKQK
jgi:hypothetical protein